MTKPRYKSQSIDYDDVKKRAIEKFAETDSVDYLDKPSIKINFFLKPNGKKTNKFSIVLSAAYGYKEGEKPKPLRYVTGLFTHPHLFDYDNYLVKEASGKVTIDGHIIQSTLIGLVKNTKQLIRSYYLSNNQKLPTPEYLKSILDQDNSSKLKKYVKTNEDKAERPSVKFYNFVKSEIEEEKITNRKISDPDSLRQYTSLLKALKLFIEFRKVEIYVGDWTEDLAKEFIHYITKKEKQADGTIDKNIKGLKKYLRRARKKFKLTLEFEDWECLVREKKNAKPKDAIALTLEELEQIAALDLSKKSDHMKWTRDLFLAACYTGGPRVSDYHKLKFVFDKSTNRYFFQYRSRKTGQYAKVPVFRNVQKIYEDYGKRFPSVIRKTLNENIEKICKMVEGMDQKEYITESRGRVKKEVAIERYKLASSHTARRTYASIMVNDFDMNPLLVMELTGHSDPEVFMEYCKANYDKLYKSTSKLLDKLNL